MNKYLQTIVVTFFLGLFSILASADHVAIVYCKPSDSGVEVAMVDADMESGIIGTAKKRMSCSQTLHEIMQLGYELVGTGFPSARGKGMDLVGGQIVFILSKDNDNH